MAHCQITCINLSNSGRTHEHITTVGNGGNWTRTVQQVIQLIKTKTDSFFVQDSYGRQATVGVVEPAGRVPYLRTFADGEWTDNLLSLTSCPL
jgi:hypothetical protein